MKKKRILSAFCALAMIFASAAPQSVLCTDIIANADLVIYNNFELELMDDDTYAVLHYDYNVDDGLVNPAIPQKFDGKPVTVICEYAFHNNGDQWVFSSIYIPSGIKRIVGYAFYGCSGVKKFTIPETVTDLSGGFGPFTGCSGLLEIEVAGDNPNYTSYDGALYNKDMTELLFCPAGKSKIEIPEGVETIGRAAFLECKSLESVVLPDSVTTIEDEAFSYCENLKSISLGSGLKSIGDSAFESCENLDNVVLPESLEKIEKCAFRECSDLSAIVIPDGITEIGTMTFSHCSSLETAVIPESVSLIGDGAFYGCSSLKSITIPEGVDLINGTTFRWCSSLSSVTLPSTLTGIDDYAFYGCEALSQITIPDGVICIAWNAFENCNNLLEITLPNSVEDIYDYAFGYTYEDGDEEDKKIEGFTIKGYKGSAAETYANDNGFTFIALPDPITLDLTLKAPEGSNLAIETATITIAGQAVKSVDGKFTLPPLEDGEYEMTISAENYVPRTYNITVSDGKIVEDIKPELHLIGDATGDGKINNSDLLAVKSHIKGIKKLTDYDLACANADGSTDNKLNNSDLLKLKSHIKGINKLW